MTHDSESQASSTRLHLGQREDQVTLPVEALERAGIRTGDTPRAEVRGPGEVLLVREVDPVTQFAGALTGVYPPRGLDSLRDEWD